MKKSLVALAVLAASSAAMAQSSVTAFGILDIAYANVQKTGTPTANVLQNGALNGSRWGFKGSEDLGGGLKANFKLVGGMAVDTGASSTGSVLFGREIGVGFSGGFGEVYLGRLETPFDNVDGDANALWDSTYFSPAELLFQSNKYTARPNNEIYYQSPKMSGFSGALSYAFGENATATVGAGSLVSGNIAYGNGPLKLSAAYQVEKATDASTSVEYTRINAGYDIGAATLKVQYGKADNIAAVSGANADEWALGVDYKVSGALTLTASVVTSSDNAAAGNADRKGWGVGAKYALSKRTFLYGAYESDTTSKPATADVDSSKVVAGIQHRF